MNILVFVHHVEAVRAAPASELSDQLVYGLAKLTPSPPPYWQRFFITNSAQFPSLPPFLRCSPTAATRHADRSAGEQTSKSQPLRAERGGVRSQPETQMSEEFVFLQTVSRTRFVF